jgi:hypothetical protein
MSNLIDANNLKMNVFLIGANGKATKLLSSQEFSSEFSGWIHFDVTKALDSWKNDRASNMGLLITIEHEEKILSQEEAEQFGIFHEKGVNDPFMVGYFTRKLPKMTIESPPESQAFRDKRSTSTENSNPLLSSAKRRPCCQLNSIYINFRDLNEMFENVIAPNGVTLNVCQGECAFPLTAHLNATNHAIVQSLVHLKQPWLMIPRPRCVPRRYMDVTVLYMNRGTPDLQVLEKFQAKFCGCQ